MSDSPVPASNTELFLQNLRALQHSLLSSAHTIGVLLDLADRPPTDPGVVEDTMRSTCSHPMTARMPTPTMGHPSRFHCRACNKEVEG